MKQSRRSSPPMLSATGFPPASVRNMGTYMVATKGTGKSRFLGKSIAWTDLLNRTAQVVIDPAGGTIDNLLDSVLRLPDRHQREVLQRIIYIDMGHRESVVPWPLYYRFAADEGTYQVSQRYLDMVRMLDPHLQSASVEGWNALWEVGTKAGMVLTSLGGQVVDVPLLLANLKIWNKSLIALAEDDAECRVPVQWLVNTLAKLPAETQIRRTAAFVQKTSLLTLDASRRAMFGASKPGIDWQTVIDQGQTVLVDFRHVHDFELRRFLMLWVLMHCISFVKQRGIGRHRPLGLLIDEVSVLTNLDQQTGSELFALLLDELLNVWARQGQVWVTIAHQEVWQVSPRLLKTLMGCGTRIIGRTSDADSAMALAQQLVPIDPHQVKRYEPVFGEQAEIIYRRPVSYTLEEQRYLASTIYQGLGKFRFVAKTLDGEGGGDLDLRPLSIAELAPGAYPDDALLQRVRAVLHKRTAIPVSTVLAEIEERQAQWRDSGCYPIKQAAGSDIVPDKDYDEHGYVRE